MKKILKVLPILLIALLLQGCPDSTSKESSKKAKTTTEATTRSTTKKTSSSKTGSWNSANVKDDGTGQGPYYCYGKNNTCNNKTKNYRDLYCDSCDPDGDNVEG